MTVAFDPTKHPRGNPGNRGQFRKKKTSVPPDTSLRSQAVVRSPAVYTSLIDRHTDDIGDVQWLPVVISLIEMGGEDDETLYEGFLASRSYAAEFSEDVDGGGLVYLRHGTSHPRRSLDRVVTLFGARGEIDEDNIWDALHAASRGSEPALAVRHSELDLELPSRSVVNDYLVDLCDWDAREMADHLYREAVSVNCRCLGIQHILESASERFGLSDDDAIRLAASQVRAQGEATSLAARKEFAQALFFGGRRDVDTALDIMASEDVLGDGPDPRKVLRFYGYRPS